MKKLLLTAVLLMATASGAHAWGCSSYAICRYRTWVRTHTPAEYAARQQRLARKCNPATIWWDACR